MKFSYNWLKELAGFKESPGKLAEFLMLRAFEVESAAKKGRDWALEVKVLPNRVADASGHVGLAREITALKKPQIPNPKSQTNSKFPGLASAQPRAGKIQNSKLGEIDQRASDWLKIVVENARDCPRYTARVMTGVKVGHTPKWMKERLEVCGLQSINNIVDAANYVMLELGQPLHVFDMRKLKSKNEKVKTIAVRRARKGEKLLALDDKAYPLSPEILVIADEAEPIAIAGIKGGKDSGVAAGTTAIVLESANFDPARTRITSRALNLKTDASFRFEHGMDPNQTAEAVDRLAQLIQEVAGGEILAGRADAYPKKPRPLKILFRPKYANRLIGEDLADKFYAEALARLGWDFTKKPTGEYVVVPPTVRRDVQIEEDLIEEMARLFGYENIGAKAPQTHLAHDSATGSGEWGRKIKDALVSAGLTETYVYEFIGRRALEIFGEKAEDLLEIENPTSPDANYLVNRPIYQYAIAAAENLRRFDDVAIFGFAKGFEASPKSSVKTPALETKYLNVAKVTKGAKAAKGTKDAENFYDVKGIIDRLLESLGVTEHWYDDALSPTEEKRAKIFHPYRRAQIKVDNEYVGIVGELHPSVLEGLKAKERIVAAEILLEKLFLLAEAEAEFKPIGKFPAIVRDIAVIVPANTKTEDVTNIIESAGGELLADSDLFDYFQDEAMEKSADKSLAFHLVFQSPERTLTDEEVNKLQRKIADALKKNGWEVRE